ELIFI
ncbi:hypothetical protein MK373_05985, partial [Streptococcus oralis]